MESGARSGSSSVPVVTAPRASDATPPRPRRPLDTHSAPSAVSGQQSPATAPPPPPPRPSSAAVAVNPSPAVASSGGVRSTPLIARPLKRSRPAANPLQFGMSLLRNQFKALSQNPPDGISVGLVDDDIFHWRVLIQGPDDTIFEGGIFPASLRFPREYPDSPPQMTFLTKGFWHPNVFTDGRVCISILHEPAEDRYTGDEPLSEKWRPVLGVEQVVLSVVSMLTDPNCDSPANMDACMQFRNSYEAYKKAVRAVVRRSQEDLG